MLVFNGILFLTRPGPGRGGPARWRISSCSEPFSMIFSRAESCSRWKVNAAVAAEIARLWAAFTAPGTDAGEVDYSDEFSRANPRGSGARSIRRNTYYKHNRI